MVTKRILITPLYGAGVKLHYYFNSNEDKAVYCDALLSAEASCKYVLANYKIDEIITFGSKSTYDPGDDLKSCVLKEGSSFYASDINSMSTYSIFRYRLAQYLDEINVEEQDVRELLDEEKQKAVKAFSDAYFRKYNSDGTKRSNRFFDHLMQDSAIRNDFISCMREKFDDFDANKSAYQTWVFQHLYNNLKDSSKMELLEGNSEVRIRFIPVGADGTGTFIENITPFMKNFSGTGEKVAIEIYMCIQSEDAYDTFVMMNLMNLIKAMPETNLSIAKIITTTRDPEGVANKISDDTDKLGITDLLAGIRAFLKYGKTDMLLDYWNMSGQHNHSIERLLYAMRNIDTGISLCDISDIERGINSLRILFSEGADFSGDSFAEKFFGMIAEGIRQDYGKLVTTDRIEFMDLVKWAYSKGFWQQTLTIIESRAPADFVNKGFYYYSNSPTCSEQVISVLGQIYFDLKPFERYKFDDICHYYVKFYNRRLVTHKDDSKAYQMDYARQRVSELQTEDPEMIKAHTIVRDKDMLRNLLFSYYYVGDVRNATNHAIEEFSGFSSIMSDSDVGERMNLISQSINYFIHCYDLVAASVADAGDSPDVDIVDLDKIVAYSRTLKPRFSNYNGGNHSGNNHGGGHHRKRD